MVHLPAFLSFHSRRPDPLGLKSTHSATLRFTGRLPAAHSSGRRCDPHLGRCSSPTTVLWPRVGPGAFDWISALIALERRSTVPLQAQRHVQRHRYLRYCGLILKRDL